MSCYVRDSTGTVVTAHDHFEGRCVSDQKTDPRYADRLRAYLAGGWTAWEQVKAAQLSEPDVEWKVS